MAGTIEAASSNMFTLPVTKCGGLVQELPARALLEPEARSTGSHCGGQATACSTSASLLAAQGFKVFGMKAKAAATPTRTTSARELDTCFVACVPGGSRG